MRIQEEKEAAKKHNPAKALRTNPEAKIVDIDSMSEFIEHKN